MGNFCFASGGGIRAVVDFDAKRLEIHENELKERRAGRYGPILTDTQWIDLVNRIDKPYKIAKVLVMSIDDPVIVREYYSILADVGDAKSIEELEACAFRFRAFEFGTRSKRRASNGA